MGKLCLSHASLSRALGTNAVGRLDLEMPGPARYATAENIQKEIKEGRLTEKQLDAAARRSLTLLKKVGKFEDRRETPVEQSIDLPHHRALIREAAPRA